MASSSSSKGSLLPFDILESILYRVPAESLNRFKLVCKRWFNLLKDKRFVYNHLDLVQEHFIHLSETLQIINPETNFPFSKPFPNELPVNSSNFIVMHCDGLLLSITQNSSKLAVWNPLVNQVRWISKPNEVFSAFHTYGFGYDSISRDNYKIIFWFRQGKDIYKHKQTCEIYEFKSDSWRTLDASLSWASSQPDRGVSMKGNMYWISLSQHMSNKCIECFDFSTETFKSLCDFPYNAYEKPFNYEALSTYREDKLSLLHELQGDIQVWITNNVKDRIVSWIKLFSVSNHDLPVVRVYSPFALYFIDKSDRINLISYKVEMLYTNGHFYRGGKIHIIGKDGFQTKELGPISTELGMSGYVYLPSLVLVPQKDMLQRQPLNKRVRTNWIWG